MMPEEWPVAAFAANPSAPARSATRDRLSTVRRDFFLDPSKRLTEQERALMSAMLHCLVADIAAEIRAALPPDWVPANDGDDQTLFDRLAAAGLLDHEELMRHLLRRADEERIAALSRSRAGRRDARLVQRLISSENGAVAASAMALIMARGRRRDRMGQCLVTIDDIPDDAAFRLVQAIAASFRAELAGARGGAAADDALNRAAAEVFGRRDPERGLDRLVGTVVGLFDATGKLTDAILLEAAGEGEILFVAEALARRSGIDALNALDELVSGDSARAMGLLRMAGASRQFAARLLSVAGEAVGLEDPGAAIEIFDRMNAEEIEGIRAWLHSHPVYRSATRNLGGRRG